VAARAETSINADTSLRQLKRAFPDIGGLLRTIGYAPITRMIISMSSPDSIPLSNIARAAGLTEIEIDLLVEELNERLSRSLPRKGRKARTKGKAKAKSRTATKPKTRKKVKVKAKAKKVTKGKTGAKAKRKGKAKRPKRRAR
jgi:hypothetical protein